MSRAWHHRQQPDLQAAGLPLDHPTLRGPFRVYLTLTNRCNRSCPWCSTCSSGSGDTWLSREHFVAALPAAGRFEVQLEGGEPTLHPELDAFVELARDHPRCDGLVLSTNGVLLPREQPALAAFLRRLGAACTVKLSVNHHLLARDPGLLRLATLIRDTFSDLGGDGRLVLNVRLRRGVGNDDQAVRDAVVSAGLAPWANIFFLQRQGFAEPQTTWDRPFLEGTWFNLVNPDGRHFGTDLLARTEAMRQLHHAAPTRRPSRAPEPAPDLRAPRPFQIAWRRRKYQAYDLLTNSTARAVKQFDLWGAPVTAYANANLSLYSGQECNGDCPFCVEKLRPAVRGWSQASQRRIEPDDKTYFEALDQVLTALAPLDPSVSLTGGEPSLDPRLPRLLRVLARHDARKRTVTTNGSGLLDLREGRTVMDWIADTGVRHLNLSRAHAADAENARLMCLGEQALTAAGIREVVRRASGTATRVRLSCALLRPETATLEDALGYLGFAESLGVDNVVFRQLMLGGSAPEDPVIAYSNQHRVALEPLLERVSADPRFTFVKQVLGYYYYVEVWRYRGIDVVFEKADLDHLEITKQRHPGIIHELIFHPNGRLGATWQPTDPPLGPPTL